MAKRVDIASGDYLKGLNDVIENLQEEVDKMQHNSVAGMKDALLYVANESQKRAPVEFGDLRGSVIVEIDNTVIAKGNPSNLSDEEKKNRKEENNVQADSGTGLTIVLEEVPEGATVGSVSYNTPYAADQHEHTEYDHPLGGQAKYLESVLTGDEDRILQLIANGKIDE